MAACSHFPVSSCFHVKYTETLNHFPEQQDLPPHPSCYFLTFWTICSCLQNYFNFSHTEDSIKYSISNSSGIQIGSNNYMKIEEQNQHISTSPVTTEASYSYFESQGIFGKRNISVDYPLIVISESFVLEAMKAVQLSPSAAWKNNCLDPLLCWNYISTVLWSV